MLFPKRFKHCRPLILLAVLLLILIELSVFHDIRPSRKIERLFAQKQTNTTPQGATGACDPELQLLRQPSLGLSSTIHYTRRCIKPLWRGKTDRASIAEIDRSLLGGSDFLNLTTCPSLALELCDTISLEVTRPPTQRRYPHLLFGVSTSSERLRSSLPAFSHWLPHTDVRLLAIVVEEDARQVDISAIETTYRQAGIELTAFTPRRRHLTVHQNHFSILEDLVDTATPETQWLAIIDDDTFFPSLAAVDKELSNHDASKPTWIGALSEDSVSIAKWGHQAFGGAGVFLSVPLAEQLVSHMDDCLSSASGPQGDVILRDCITAHTSIKLTLLPRLYQHDLRGDVSGFYESGAHPLSVHHWKSWYREPIPQMAAVQKVCGECFLQRWQFGNDTLFANGYSISTYAKGLAEYDMEEMEATWSLAGSEFEERLGPLRKALGPEDKKSFKLRDAVFMDDGRFRQLYVHQGDWTKSELDEVVELVWLPS